MMKAAVLLLALCVATVSAQREFLAVAGGNAATPAAEGSLWAQDGVVEWTLNVTGLAPGAAVTASIVDGHPGKKVDPVALLVTANETAVSAEDGTFEAAGAFTQAELTEAYQNMPIEELLGHIGMGHIYLQVSTPEGALNGAWAETGVEADAAAADMGGMEMGGVDHSGMDHGSTEHAH